MAERPISTVFSPILGVLVILGIMGLVGWVALSDPSLYHEIPSPQGRGPILNTLPVLIALAVVAAVASAVTALVRCGECGKRKCVCPGVPP